MALNYHDLNDEVRTYMLSELESDVVAGRLYDSDNISPSGKAPYPGILKTVFGEADDEQLAEMILPLLNSHERPRLTKRAVRQLQKCVSTLTPCLPKASLTTFYMRGVCLSAIEHGIAKVVVYRARYSETPRPESEAKVGQELDPHLILANLRQNVGLDTYLGVPNSGLSLRLP